MYHTHKKSGTSVGEETTPMDCFVERTRNWFWTIIIFVLGTIVYAIVTSAGQGSVYSAAGQSYPQGGQFQNAALIRCPYCSGFLDANQRCSVPGCPIYSPNWGKPLSSKGIPVRRMLIKELAMEVDASEGKESVIIQSVYGGGNAEKGGLRAGDRIVRFNGRNVKNVKQFKSTVTRARPETTVKIQVIRNKNKIKSIVMIGKGEMEGVTVPTTQRW